MNIEVVRGSGPARGQIFPKAQVHIKPCEEEVFYSMFGMDQSIYAHVEAARPVTEFTGTYYADFLYLRIDRDGDVLHALESTRQLVRRIYEHFAVSPRLLTLYYSGNKSFSIGLHQALFGNFAPAHDLPAQLRTLSGLLVATCYNLGLETVQQLEVGTLAAGGYHFADVDNTIYRPGQLLRAPNSRHSLTGRYKIPLYASELLTTPMQKMHALATAPRTSFTPPPHLASEPAIESLTGLWRQALTYEVAGQTKLPAPPADANFFAPPPPGSRSSTLYHQACRLFDSSTLELAHVSKLVEAINTAGTAPLPVAEVRGLVAAAAYRTGVAGQLNGRPGRPRPGSVVPATGLPWANPPLGFLEPHRRQIQE